MIGEYVYDSEGGRHQAFYSPTKDTVVLGIAVRAQERIQIEQSLKYSPAAATALWDLADMKEVEQWNVADEYGECALVVCVLVILQKFRDRRTGAFQKW